MDNEKYYEILMTTSKYSEFVSAAEIINNEQVIFKILLYHYGKKECISFEQFENLINKFDDENSTILLTETMFIECFSKLKRKYPKLLTTIKIRQKDKWLKEIDKVKNDEEFHQLTKLGTELIKSDFHPFHTGIALAILYDYLGDTNKAVDLLTSLYQWYPTSEILNRHILLIQLNIFLRNGNSSKFQNLLRKLNNQKEIILYKQAYFSINHQFFLLFLDIALISVLFIFVKYWAVAIFLFLLFINSIIAINSTKFNNRTLTLSYLYKIVIIIIAFVTSLFLFFVWQQ